MASPRWTRHSCIAIQHSESRPSTLCITTSQMPPRKKTPNARYCGPALLSVSCMEDCHIGLKENTGQTDSRSAEGAPYAPCPAPSVCVTVRLGVPQPAQCLSMYIRMPTGRCGIHQGCMRLGQASESGLLGLRRPMVQECTVDDQWPAGRSQAISSSADWLIIK